MTSNNTGAVFDYRALRLLMGIIALTLPFLVTLLSSSPLSSISASYYTEARDALVGMLFVVGALLWAYNGHSIKEAVASKIASVAAICVVMFPAACDICETNIISKTHYGAAVILFAILAYFCFVPFRLNTKGKKGKKGRRSKIYFVCGWIMVGCMLSLLIAKLMMSAETMEALSVTYWLETIALVTFGFAWIVAGKYIRFFVDEDEALRLFRQ